MKNKKTLIKIIIGIVLIVIITIVLWSIFIKTNKKFTRTNTWYDVDDLPLSAQLYPVKNNDNWVYIDTTGKIVIENNYDYAYYFYGDIAEVELNDERYLIDKNGNTIESSIDNFYDDYDGAYIVNGNLYYKNTKKLNNDNISVYPFKNDIGLNNYLEDTGLFGFYNEKDKTTGIINRNGEIIYKTKSSNKIELKYDKASSENYNNFTSRYCTIEVDNKSGLINCDSGVEIYPLSEKYTYKLAGSNFIKIYKNNEFIKTVYIYKDKVKRTFDEEIKSVINEDSNNYITIINENNQEYMLLDGTIIKEDDEGISGEDNIKKYNNYRRANFLLKDKFKIFIEQKLINEDDHYTTSTKYGVKKADKLILPAEYDKFYFNIDNDKYIIGFKEKEKDEENDKFYLYSFENSSTALLESYDMGFLNKNLIYYYSENTQIIYNLETKKELIIDKDARIYAYNNFIEIIRTGGSRIIYDSNFNIIYQY